MINLLRKRKISIGIFNPEELDKDTIYVSLWGKGTSTMDVESSVSALVKSNKEFKYITYSKEGEKTFGKGKEIKDLMLDSPLGNYKNFINGLQKINHVTNIEYRIKDALEMTLLYSTSDDTMRSLIKNR